MTRFARAKGSKASNERKEEDATPWHIMRQQLGEQLNKNNNDFKEKSSLAGNTTNMNVSKPVEEMWSEFNEFKIKKTSVTKDTKRKFLEKLPKIKNENAKSGTKKTNEINVVSISNNDHLNAIKDDPLKPNKTTYHSMYDFGKSINTELKTERTSSKGNIHIKPIAKNKSKQDKSNTEHSTLQTYNKNTVLEESEDVRFNSDVYINKNNNKINSESTRKKLNTNKFRKFENTNTELEQTRLISLEPFYFETSHTLKNPKYFTSNISKNGNKEELSLQVTNHKKGFKKELQCFSNKNSYGNVQTIIANGRKIEIVKFEAFWIKKEDAIKLKELRKKLRDQKMPKDKIKTILKLERRKAEKALSREKTNVCYHCRKFGHKFSECPEINNSSMSTSGICFKCGSTEHTYFECKVTHTQNFRYAVCFVCNEQGHIARQCSLNPQGQYPKGGSCHLCGEVTHLRKDCPMASEEKPSSFVTAEKINSVELEYISEMKTNEKTQNLLKNKVVLF